jgi:2-polyprenyl-3-methyl-5-hydroxy-6-metoxy-1,4-benzoquinol methylase
MMAIKQFRDVSIARVRDFWNARPCNIRHSSKPVGEREYFEEVEARKYYIEPHIPRFAEFPRWARKRVLEIGCGIGTDTINFARAGASVTAVDLSDRSLEIAQRRAALCGCTNITFVQANVERLATAIPVEPYDLVYSFGVIHHTPQPQLALAQIRSFLAPQGTLKLMLYHRYSWKALSIVMTYGRGAFWKWDEIIARHSEAQEGCPVTYTYTRREILELIETIDCKVENMFVDHIFPWRIADYIQYRYRRVWYFAMLPPPLFRSLEKHFGWHLCVTAVAQ